MSTPALAATSTSANFLAGVKSAILSVFFLVLAGTYIGIGALAHDFGFSSWWLALSSILVWAAPAQVILVSALGNGASLIEAAIAVTLSAIRLFPMVPVAADAFHFGEHVGRVAAAIAGIAA
jgi:predicted branched-subunit amino acid permease